MKHFFIIFMLFAVVDLTAQDNIVHDNLRKLAHGKINEVKAQIPDLLAKYPDDPGVKLLHGAILDDGEVAVKIYQKIIDKHSDSQWADDAYWRTVQYYAISGDIDKAKRMLDNFRRRFPASPYVAPASDVVLTVEKMMNNGNDLAFNSKKDSQVEDKVIVKDTEYVQDYARPNKDTDLTTEPDEIAEDNSDELKSKENEIEVDSQNETVDIITYSDDYDGFYGLQVGIYRDYESAETEKNKFLKQRLRTSIAEKDIDGEKMYAVVIGHYSSIQSAEAAKIIVKRQCGCDPIIYKKEDN